MKVKAMLAGRAVFRPAVGAVLQVAQNPHRNGVGRVIHGTRYPLRPGWLPWPRPHTGQLL